MNLPVVPNLFPKIPPVGLRLAVIGEAPGADEVVVKEPFVGASGKLLRAVLGNNNVSCDTIFFGNICQHNPPGNKIELFDFNGPEIQTGLERLREDLRVFRPNCLLLLGRTAFRAFRPDLCYPTKKGFHVPLADWRGSIFEDTIGSGYKCVGTYHPAYILRSYQDNPFFRFDVARAVRLSRSSERWIPPKRGGITRPLLSEVLDFFFLVRLNRYQVSFDYEGYCDDIGITMASFAVQSNWGIVIPFWIEGTHYWTEDEEVLVWDAILDWASDPNCPKTIQNCFYETFLSAWRHRFIINNIRDDTMMKHWEKFPESGGDVDNDDTGKKKKAGLGRDLGTLCSIYTEQPFYKADRTSPDVQVKLNYSLLDALCPVEINQVLETQLAQVPSSYNHYRFNINLIPAYNYIMLRGCRFDIARARDIAQSVELEISVLQGEVDSAILADAVAADVVTRKRKSDPYHFNVDSGNQLRWLLFEHLAYKPSARKVTKTGKQKTDEDVLLTYFSKHQNPLLRTILRLTRKKTRLSDIHKLVYDSDSRIRSNYDPCGTNTGRLSSRKSTSLRWTGSDWSNTGTNLQNVTKELRVCFIPDSPDFDFWQADLQGADAWTVAADLAHLGYPAMLEDLLYGIKPALVLYYMLQVHAARGDVAAVNRLDRATLKAKLKEVKNEIDLLDGKTDSGGRPLDWQYLCCKRVQHGSNYGAQPEKISEVIFGDSDGTISLTKTEASLYQQLYKLRYQTDHRNTWLRRRLSADGYLTAACGIRRQFFNIRNRYDIDDAIVREAAAFEPQANTTWATNKALERLWYDESNRQSSGALFIEPLLQIHDALAGQYPSRDKTWAGERIKEWFRNPLRIAGTELVIPADAKWGTDWKNCNNAII